MCHILYSYNMVSYREENVKKMMRKIYLQYFTVLKKIHMYVSGHKQFKLSLLKCLLYTVSFALHHAQNC